VLECYHCGCRNVFLLGFIPSQADSVVVLLCREPCLTLGALKDQGWDLTMWEPLIQDRTFLHWLVPPPSEREAARARHVTPSQAAALEILWRTDPAATFTDLLRAEAEGLGPGADVLPVQLRYDDGFQYQNVFGPLVKLEADEDKAYKAAMKATGVAVRWSRNVHRAWTARFVFNRGPESELKLVPGDEMCLKLPSFASQFVELDRLVAASRGSGGAEEDEGAWKGVGFVKEIRDGEVLLEIATSSAEVSDHMPTSGFTAEIVWRSVTFDRMQAALKKFAVDDASVTGYLYHSLLGHAVEPQMLKATLPATYSAPGLPELNPSQMAAVRTVLLRPLSLIQGPPGTGKTVTSATIVYHLSKQGMGQVLVTAPSNVAVDHLTAKIAQTGLKVVRVMARSRESMPSLVDDLCLHNMVLEAAPPKGDLRKLAALKAEQGELSPKDLGRLRRLTREAEKAILAAADVICTTCAGAGDSHFSDLRFRQVLIDEATQAAEPECMIPIVQGCKQLVLVGDHCQLGPVITAKRAANAGLGQSLFERLILLGIRPIRLTVQYRMHPALSEFPSNTFYEGALQNGVTLAERTPPAHELLNWPVPGRPMYFYISSGAEEMSGSGTSYLNRGEAQVSVLRGRWGRG
jgi:regulator of nonsense transcripts 1